MALRSSILLLCTLPFLAACPLDGWQDTTTAGDGDTDGSTGDGDGDTTPGDGDADPGDGDADPSDGDGDPGDGDGDPGDGDGDPGDGDGDGDTTRSVLLRVTALGDVGIPKASVTIDGAVHFTDSAGFLRVADPVGDLFRARVDATGHTSSAVAIKVADGVHAYREVQLFPLGEPQLFDAELGGTVEIEGASVSFPPGALVDRFGDIVTGTGEVTITVIDPSQVDARALPGPFEGRTNLDEDVSLLSLGMTEVSLWQDGMPVELDLDATAMLSLSIPDALADNVVIGQEIPAWSLDLDEGVWIEENVGIVEFVNGELRWTTEVEHFSLYNIDLPWNYDDFECYVVSVEDTQGMPLAKGFSLRSDAPVGVFVEGGFSSLSPGNLNANCARALIGTVPVPTLTTIEAFDFQIAGVTGVYNPCKLDGLPNPSCAQIEITVPPEAPPVICSPGDYEACPYPGPMNTEGVGACEAGYNYCIEDGTAWSGCVGEWTPQAESCLTPFDDDCDGMSDDPDAIDCECMEGQTTSCYSGPLGTNGVGECISGERSCDLDTDTFAGECIGEIEPQMEDCDSPEDENCDGDSGCNPPTAPTNLVLNLDQVKQLDFTWTPSIAATHYQLLEQNVGDLDYAQVGEDTMQTAISLPVPTLLHRRLGSSYVVRACNDWGCTDSESVEVAGVMAEAIGYFKSTNADAMDLFGASVALSADGSLLAVGAEKEDSAATGLYNGYGDELDNAAPQSGAVYLFERDPQGRWEQLAYVKASNAEANDLFGNSVALSPDGDTLIVGALGEASGAAGIDGNQADNSAAYAGAVYVFERDGQGQWFQQAYIKSSNPGTNDGFGQSVSLSDDGRTLAVGAWNEASNATGINGNQADNSAESAGAVYVFVRDDQEQWSQQAYVKASNTDAGDDFGSVVVLSADGDTLAVSAPYEESSAVGINGEQFVNSALAAGAVYVYVRDDQEQWSQQAYVKPSSIDAIDRFGESVDLSADGNMLAVGSPGEDGANGINGDDNDDSLPSSGAVYVFVRSVQGQWSQRDYVKTSNRGQNDQAGTSVALSPDGETLVVGALYERSSAVGIGGEQDDDSIVDSGAAYLFVLDGQAQWSQEVYIKASNTGQSDNFALELALSDDASTLVVASNKEDSSARGISSNQNDDAGPNAGAVYVY